MVGERLLCIRNRSKKESKSNYVRHVSWIDKNHINILKEQSFNKKTNWKKKNTLAMKQEENTS